MNSRPPIALAVPARRKSLQAHVVWGTRNVTVGGDAPVRLQSMTNTDTADAIGTAIQVKELAIAGSEMVRIWQLQLTPTLTPIPKRFHGIGIQILSSF